MKHEAYDSIVIGGGALGTCVAYGLARSGERVCVIDEEDQAFRASRGNFGLVWVQGKGVGNVPYARWTMAAAAAWPSFAAELKELTGIDVELSQPVNVSVVLHRSMSVFPATSYGTNVTSGIRARRSTNSRFRNAYWLG